MNTRHVIVVIVASALIVGGLQQTKLSRLRASDHQIVAAPETRADEVAVTISDENTAPVREPMTDEELNSFTTALFAIKDQFETNLWLKYRYDMGAAHPAICDSVLRLSTDQLRSVIEAWPDGESDAAKIGIRRFRLLAGEINPGAAVPLELELLLKTKDAFPLMQTLPKWFRQDAKAVASWVRRTEVPRHVRDLTEVWAIAAEVTDNPTTENVKKLISYKDIWNGAVRTEVVLKLRSQAARLAFFNSLHGATGGKSDDIGYFVWPLADRISFSQFAYIADQTPPFEPLQVERQGTFTKEYLGGLRFDVAARSRDGTATERWTWLMQRPEDRPTGKLLGRLVKSWFITDYQGTATWIRSLPPGTERTAAEAALVEQLKNYGGGKRLAEWQKK